MRNQTFITALVLTAFCFLLLPAVFFAQTKFQVTIGIGINEIEYGHSAKQTNDGGYIITGSHKISILEKDDVYLVKIDGSGNLAWSRTFGGINDDVGYSVQQTTDGGYIIVGFTKSFGAGNSDIYLVRTDANGNLLWSRTFGGANNDNGQSVQQTTDGGFIIAGTWEINAFSSDVYLIKVDNSGNLSWSKTFGAAGFDTGNSVQQTSDGGFIISGGSGSDAYLIKTDGNGSLTWSKSFGIPGDCDNAASVCQTSDGGFLIVGYTGTCLGSAKALLIKTDGNGNLIWSRTYDMGPDSEYGISSAQQTSDGGYIFATYDNMAKTYLVKTDSNGNLSWSKTYSGGPTNSRLSVQQTTDGGYIIGAGAPDFYLIKTD